MQIKKLIVFIFLASFCSCSHKIDNKELEQSFLASISFSEYYNKLILAKFEKALSDHGSEPIEKYISKAKRVRKIVAAYSEDVYTFYYDSVSHKSIEELIKGYDSTIDSIKKSLPLYNNQDRFNSDRNIEMLKQITRINFLELKKDLSDKLIALQIINNVVQNETIMDKELYNQATDFCYLFSP